MVGRGETIGPMGSSANQGYCAFTKAVEHLGDRWSFLIVRELAMFGPQGFSALAGGLPGRISRSVLADKLRKLEDLGLVMREEPGGDRKYEPTVFGKSAPTSDGDRRRSASMRRSGTGSTISE